MPTYPELHNIQAEISVARKRLTACSHARNAAVFTSEDAPRVNRVMYHLPTDVIKRPLDSKN